jgi:hypothetical protein
MSAMHRFDLEVTEVGAEAPQIRAIRLVRSHGGPLPSWEAGAHVKARVPDGDERSYSLIDAEAGNEYVTWTPTHHVEPRLDQQDLNAAWATRMLAIIDGKLTIKLKRVDIVNVDAAFGNMQRFM